MARPKGKAGYPGVMTFAEIGARTGTTASAAYKTYQRAMRKLGLDYRLTRPKKPGDKLATV